MTEPSVPFVQAIDLTKRFTNGEQTTTALDNVTLEARPGVITGLVGPDGAGKTTLLRLFAGLLAADAGQAFSLGRDMAQNPAEARAGIGYMPQQFGLYEDLTVQENLSLYARLRGLPASEEAARFGELLAFTRLAPFAGRLAGALSGGMKQKLALACTLLRKPRLLLLDEPGVGVDPVSRRELWDMTGRLLDRDTAIIWSTAYLDEAARCDTVHLLDRGRLLFSGEPRRLTDTMKGRVYSIAGLPGDHRQALSALMHDPRVFNAGIEGSAIRLLTREPGEPPDTGTLFPQESKAAVPAVRLEETPPRFEDAFLNILGGMSRRTSGLEAFFPARNGQTGAAVEAAALTKRYGSFYAARDVSFSVRPGEVFGLLGPNGAGKTTTYKMLCGLSTPTAGAARVCGLDLARAPSAARGRIGYMAQKFSLYAGVSVLGNLRFFAQAYGLTGKRKNEAVERMIDIFELAPHAGQAAGAIPLGFRKRLSLACALIHSPDVLFLDEPTSGVDPVARQEFWLHINALVQRGVTVLVTTHFMEEAEFCDRIAFLQDGRIAALGSPDELKALAKTSETPNPTMEDAFVALMGKQAARPEGA